jgi:hypothetical protein
MTEVHSKNEKKKILGERIKKKETVKKPGDDAENEKEEESPERPVKKPKKEQ